eukprot:3210649-Pleurochrysis_carterae.AAC.4
MSVHSISHTQRCRIASIYEYAGKAARRACRLAAQAGGVHGVAKRFCGPCAPIRYCAIVCCVDGSNCSSLYIARSLEMNANVALVLRRFSKHHGRPGGGDQRGRPPQIR